MVDEETIKEHLNNLIKALVAISPSRNYISQFIALLPQYQTDMLSAYPIFIENEKLRDMMSNLFGIKYGTKIEYSDNEFSEIIHKLIVKEWKILDDDEIRKKLLEFLGYENDDELPNPYREWLGIIIKGIASEPSYGKKCIKILKTILDKNIEINTERLSEISKELKISTQDILVCIQLLEKYSLMKKGYSENRYYIIENLKKHRDLVEKAYYGVE